MLDAIYGKGKYRAKAPIRFLQHSASSDEIRRNFDQFITEILLKTDMVFKRRLRDKEAHSGVIETWDTLL